MEEKKPDPKHLEFPPADPKPEIEQPIDPGEPFIAPETDPDVVPGNMPDEAPFQAPPPYEMPPQPR